jgi:hypothetical protein
MLRLTRRELETDPQGTAPVLDPTLGGLGLATAPGYPVCPFHRPDFENYVTYLLTL